MTTASKVLISKEWNDKYQEDRYSISNENGEFAGLRTLEQATEYCDLMGYEYELDSIITAEQYEDMERTLDGMTERIQTTEEAKLSMEEMHARMTQIFSDLEEPDCATCSSATWAQWVDIIEMAKKIGESVG